MLSITQCLILILSTWIKCSSMKLHSERQRKKTTSGNKCAGSKQKLLFSPRGQLSFQPHLHTKMGVQEAGRFPPQETCACSISRREGYPGHYCEYLFTVYCANLSNTVYFYMQRCSSIKKMLSVNGIRYFDPPPFLSFFSFLRLRERMSVQAHRQNTQTLYT